MPEQNLSTQLGNALSIDAVEQFGQRVNSLLNLLGLLNKKPMNEGSAVKVYTTDVTLYNEPVAPGDVIPLSKVERTVKETKELVFNKKRKGVPIEDVQKFGQAQVIQSDAKLLNAIQRQVRKGLIEALADGTGARTGENFQQTLARNTAAVKIAFDDDDPTVVSFVNTNDAYEFLGNKDITTQSAFGLSYIQNFLDNDIIFMTADVPEGTIYSTAVENLNFYYANIDGGIIGETFGYKTNEDGFIGVKHNINDERAQLETLAIYGILFLPERLDGVVVGTIGTGTGTGEGGVGA